MCAGCAPYAFVCVCLRAYKATCATAGLFFIPLNIMIAATSIMAFISESGDGESSRILNITVGCIAAASVFISGLDRLLNFKPRADVHEAAKQVCEKLISELDFMSIRYKSHSDIERADNDPLSDDTLDGFKTKLDQVQDSCAVSVPDKISQAFKCLNTLVAVELGVKIDSETKTLDQEERIEVLRVANVTLCNEITSYWLWPMRLPNARVSSHHALDKLNDEVYKTEAKSGSGKRLARLIIDYKMPELHQLEKV